MLKDKFSKYGIRDMLKFNYDEHKSSKEETKYGE